MSTHPPSRSFARTETRFITFDCFGTLIDWESGIHQFVHAWLERHGRSDSRANMLLHYAAFEPEAQLGQYRSYREILAAVMHRFAHEYRIDLAAGEEHQLAESIRNWPPFPDTADALRRLAASYGIIILTNIDRDLFEGTRVQLPPVLSGVITSEDVQSYKPAHRHFLAAFDAYRCGPENIVHAAESLYHDIMPCKELGIPHVWVNRRGKVMGAGATRSALVQPDAEVGSLTELADRVLAP